MKRIRLILLCLASLSMVMAENKQALPQNEERLVRDSIIRMLDSMPLDSLRYEATSLQFQRNIQSDWSLELADRSVADARALHLKDKVLLALHNRFRYAQYRLDLSMVWKMLADLKKACYEYKEYAVYFKSARSALALSASNGNFEDALHRTELLRQEATTLKCQLGVVYALMAEADIYRFMEKYEKSRQTFRQVLKQEGLTDSDLLTIHGTLSSLYVVDYQYKDALRELDSMKVVLDRLVSSSSSEKKDSWNNRLLELQLSYIRIYLMVGEADNTRLHLEEARKYYSASSYIDYACKYHELWANYYALVGRWDDCLHEIDWVLNTEVSKERPMNWLALLGKKVQYLNDAGRKEESIATFELLVSESDSINKESLSRQEEVLNENSAIQQALMRKEQLQGWYRLIYIGVSGVAFCFLLVLVVRAWYILRNIKRARKITKEAMLIVQKEDKLKEAFLRNITNRINRPLSEVVHCSQLLSKGEVLQPEMMQDCSTRIRKSANNLLVLVNNILDLSRLEAGMMRFVIAEVDIVQICREAIQRTKAENSKVEIEFTSNVDEVMLSIDSARFCDMLISCFTSPEVVGISQVKCVLQVDTELSITIQGSPLALRVGEDQDAFIRNEINRLFVGAFHGTYRANNDGTVYIKFKR